MGEAVPINKDELEKELQKWTTEYHWRVVNLRNAEALLDEARRKVVELMQALDLNSFKGLFGSFNYSPPGVTRRLDKNRLTRAAGFLSVCQAKLL